VRRPGRLAAAATALAVALAATGRTAHAAASERELGRRFLLEARSQLPLVEDPAVVEFVQRVSKRIVDTLGPQEFDYRFYVVQSPSLNAFAVPGGYVFIFSGLLARVASEDELAGVLGHEIGHVHAHHITRLQSEGAVWNVPALMGVLLSAVNPVIGAAAIAAAQTAQLKFSRDFEQEADFLGLRFTTEAGFDPHAMGGFFKTILAEQRLNPTGVPAYMLTHPLAEDRISNIETTIKAQGLKTPAGRPASGIELAEVQAVSRAMMGPVDAVIADYRRPAEERPKDAERQFLLGRVYQTVGQLEAARGALERARELGGVDGRVDRPLGAVYVALKAKDQARATLGRHLARHPTDAWSHLTLGKVLADADDPDGARREFERAIRLDPELDEAHRLAGLTLGRKGREADGFYHLAVASRLRGDLEQSLNQFRRTADLLREGEPRREEVERAIAELRPLVVERERDRQERQRRRRGLR
jgi:predicted Zn-dependent protease